MFGRVVILSLCLVALALSAPAAAPAGLDIARVRPEIDSRMENAGWGYDRYRELHALRPGEGQAILDATGPGVVRQIHITNMRQNMGSEKMQNRDDVVIEIWFDDATTPAVRCPLTFFFCGGDLNTPYFENGPGAWNCYFPMPFKKRARVVLVNDGPDRIHFYSFVEWERLPRWEKDLGYFHACFERRVFQLTNDSREVVFETHGAGQFLGRYWLITTDEPIFRNWGGLMEGNNELDIDGVERKIDYLGSEDSFNFSWGFQRSWHGLRAGIIVNTTDTLGLYRFHDPMPIRFKKSLRWTLNYQQEKLNKNFAREKAVQNNSHWVNYRMVNFWYQDSPGGYEHVPLRPLEQRKMPLIRD